MPKPKNLEKTAYYYIKEQIDARQWLPQTHITEQNLSKELKISRTPIRQAFQRLQEEGYVEIEPYKGAKIKEQAIDSRGVQERLEFIELILVHYLHYLQIKEITINEQKMEKTVVELKKSSNKTEKEFLQLETQFIYELLSFSKNHYSVSAVMDTVRELQIQSNPMYRAIMRKNRDIRSHHYGKITEYVKVGEYALARKEIRILINQLSLSIIHNYSD